jgi:hypothetical protein
MREDTTPVRSPYSESPVVGVVPDGNAQTLLTVAEPMVSMDDAEAILHTLAGYFLFSARTRQPAPPSPLFNAACYSESGADKLRLAASQLIRIEQGGER